MKPYQVVCTKTHGDYTGENAFTALRVYKVISKYTWPNSAAMPEESLWEFTYVMLNNRHREIRVSKFAYDRFFRELKKDEKTP